MLRPYPIMFPYLKIAKNFACTRTKTSLVFNVVIMRSLKKYLVHWLSKEPYALVNDGSSDADIKKMNDPYALIYHVNRSREVEFKCYNIISTSNKSCLTVQTFFESISQQLIKDCIWWQQSVSVVLDNTISNIGTKCPINLA